MSYCVNCGVKLEQSLKSCPLCHTPVINPNEIKNEDYFTDSSPFSNVKGEVEPMKKHDIGLWLTIVLGSTAIACSVLNFFAFHHNYWSVPVIGACIILWLFFCPRMFFSQIPVSLNLLVSGFSVVFYEFSLTLLTKSDQWFFQIALPITLVLITLTAIAGMFYKFVSHSLIATVLYFFLEVAFLCVAIESFVDKFLVGEIHLFWSAIVFSVCAVISIALIALLSIARLRETVRKRLHF